MGLFESQAIPAIQELILESGSTNLPSLRLSLVRGDLMLGAWTGMFCRKGTDGRTR